MTKKSQYPLWNNCIILQPTTVMIGMGTMHLIQDKCGKEYQNVPERLKIVAGLLKSHAGTGD